MGFSLFLLALWSWNCVTAAQESGVVYAPGAVDLQELNPLTMSWNQVHHLVRENLLETYDLLKEHELLYNELQNCFGLEKCLKGFNLDDFQYSLERNFASGTLLAELLNGIMPPTTTTQRPTTPRPPPPPPPNFATDNDVVSMRRAEEMREKYHREMVQRYGPDYASRQSQGNSIAGSSGSSASFRNESSYSSSFSSNFVNTGGRGGGGGSYNIQGGSSSNQGRGGYNSQGGGSYSSQRGYGNQGGGYSQGRGGGSSASGGSGGGYNYRYSSSSSSGNSQQYPGASSTNYQTGGGYSIQEGPYPGYRPKGFPSQDRTQGYSTSSGYRRYDGGRHVEYDDYEESPVPGRG